MNKVRVTTTNRYQLQVTREDLIELLRKKRLRIPDDAIFTHAWSSPSGEGLSEGHSGPFGSVNIFYEERTSNEPTE